MEHITYQIWDYVLVNNKPAKIGMVTKKNIGYYTEENETVMHYARMCDVKNIPITKEILEQNRFIYTEDDEFVLNLDDKGFPVFIKYGSQYLFIKKTDTMSMVGIRCEYLHELQETLRLLKID